MASYLEVVGVVQEELSLDQLQDLEAIVSARITAMGGNRYSVRCVRCTSYGKASKVKGVCVGCVTREEKI